MRFAVLLLMAPLIFACASSASTVRTTRVKEASVPASAAAVSAETPAAGMGGSSSKPTPPATGPI